MSGIAAIWHRDGRPVQRASLNHMVSVIPYRGVDGQGSWTDGAIGLGHGRFAVTHEDLRDDQPLLSPRTNCAIVADVRLDNRDELMAYLPERLSPTLSDAELILRSYEHDGFDALPRLLGDFAFVLWDPRKQRLVCARDTSGQRSLFYRYETHTCAIASEIHQLLQDPSVPVAPDLQRVHEYLVPRNLMRNEAQTADTFYQGIYSVPAGHVLIIDRDNIRVQRYWELSIPRELRYAADDQYVEHFRDLFALAVKARLRSAGPSGALLSGGLDSGSVVCMAQALYGRGAVSMPGFTSFSMAFDGLSCDERPFIDDMQAAYGFESRFVSCGSFAGRVQLQPEGFFESPNLGVAQGRDALLGEATRAGVRVLLTGEMADACVGGGQLVFDSLLRQRKVRALVQHMQAYHRTSGERWRRIVLWHTLLPLLPGELQRDLRAARIQRDWRRVQSRLLPDWMPQGLRALLSQRQLRLMLQAERTRRFANPVQQMEYELLYPPEVARHPVPWPVEMWRPFADRRLHAFLLAIPPEQKYGPHPDTDAFYAGSKHLLRRSMRGILPERVRTRTTKTVFNTTLEQEIVRQWPVYEAAFGPGGRALIAEYELVDRQRFWRRLQQIRDGASGQDLIYVMQLAGLETWLRSFDQPRPQQVRVTLDAGRDGGSKPNTITSRRTEWRPRPAHIHRKEVNVTNERT